MDALTFHRGIGHDQFRLREAFVQAGNVIKSQPKAKFWAGQRYYRRYQIHINDFYISDMSGDGGGVEDLSVKVGKMSIAYLAGARPEHGRLTDSRFKLPKIERAEDGSGAKINDSIWKHPNLLFGAIGIFA